MKFGVEEYYEMLNEANKLEGFIKQHWEIMGEFDHQHHTKILSMSGDRGTAPAPS